MVRTATHIGILVVLVIIAGGAGIYFAGITTPSLPMGNYTLTIQAPSGQGTTSTISRYARGTTVKVMAVSASGWKFDHWILDGTSVGSDSNVTVTMNSDHTIQADFTQTTPLTTNVVTVTVSKLMAIVTVGKATVGITTTPPTDVVAGGSVSDSASLTGGVGAGGSVIYTLYSGVSPGGTQVGNPSMVTVTNGVVPDSDNFTVQAAGFYYFTASYSGDENNNAASATAEIFIVGPSTLNHFGVDTISSPQTAGTSFSIMITAQDQYNNTVTSYSGTPTLSDLSSTISPTITGAFSSGVWTGSVTITKTYTGDTITVMDSGKTGTSGAFNVGPAALASFAISGYPSSINAGQNFGSNNVIVTAYDSYGNVKTDYTGNVYFNSSDSVAVLPFTSGSMYTFTSGSGVDNGIHTFAGTGFTLNTAGIQTITVIDRTTTATSIDVKVIPALPRP